MLKIVKLKLPNSKTVNFSLFKNELVILTGKSGSGKTLFLKSLAGLIPANFDCFEFNDISYENLDWPKTRSELLYLQQKPVKVSGTVEDMLKKPFLYKANAHKKFKMEQLSKYLNTLELSVDFIKKDSNHLSGGEEQMVAILRSLLLDPQVLLLDEPTAAVDRDSTKTVEKLIIDWQKSSAKNPAVVFVTHDEGQEMRLPGKMINFDQLVQ